MNSDKQLKEIIKSFVKEMVSKKLKEVSATGGVSSPATKFAFGKVKDRVSRQAGYSPVSGPSAEVNEGKKKDTKKKFNNPEPKETKPINEPIGKSDVDYINKEKKTAVTKKDAKKVKSITKLQQLVKRSSPFYRINEETSVNIKPDVDALTSTIETAKYNAINAKSIELKKKLANKQVIAHASKGYGQLKRDYTINVTDAKYSEYYDKPVIILIGSDKKEYFVDVDYKVKIVGGSVPVPTGSQPTGQPEAPAPVGQPVTDLSKEIQK